MASLSRFARPRTITVGACRGAAGPASQARYRPAAASVRRVRRCARPLRETSAAPPPGSGRRDVGEIIGGLGQRRGGQARRQRRTTRFSTVPSSPDQDRHRPVGVEPHELDVLEHHVGLGGDTTPAPWLRPESRSRLRSSTSSSCRGCAVRSAASIGGARPRRRRRLRAWRRRKTAGPAGRLRARREVCGAPISPRSSRSAMTLRTEAGDRPTASMRDSRASRPARRSRDSARRSGGRCPGCGR